MPVLSIEALADLDSCASLQTGDQLTPWEANPYRLISWWAMEKFAAEKFCTICTNLTSMSGNLAHIGLTVSPKNTATLCETLKALAQDCKQIGLKVTALQVEAVICKFEAHSTFNFPAVQISQILDDLATAISCEMETHLFLRVFPERADFYKQDELFGPQANVAFQSAKRDIKSAGTCYACDQNTACVMHLMRVLEVGLSVLARELKVLFDRRNWENVINDIEAEIKKINGPAWGPDWKAKQQFYSGAAKDFRYFKDAWRNHAMHFREHYEAAEAKSILDHVKSFMIVLADGGLHE